MDRNASFAALYLVKQQIFSHTEFKMWLQSLSLDDDDKWDS